MKRAARFLANAASAILFTVAIALLTSTLAAQYRYYNEAADAVLSNRIAAQASEGLGRPATVGREELVAMLLAGIDLEIQIGDQAYQPETFRVMLFDFSQLKASRYTRSYVIENGRVKRAIYQEE